MKLVCEPPQKFLNTVSVIVLRLNGELVLARDVESGKVRRIYASAESLEVIRDFLLANYAIEYAGCEEVFLVTRELNPQP